MTYAARPDREGSKAGSAPLAFHAPGPLAWFEPWRGTPYARRGEAYVDLKRQRAEAVIAFVDRFRVGLKSRVEKWVASTPLTNLHFNGSEDGSAYGIYHSIAHSGARALGPRTRLTNLLLTGQSTLFPGLLGAATSGLRTAGALVGLKPILRELRALE
jgi:all-trans-retinol 13,14-reductase